MNRKRIVKAGRSTWKRMQDHNAPVAAAGIAFLSLVAMVPGLVALVSIYGMVADPADIESQVADLGTACPRRSRTCSPRS